MKKILGTIMTVGFLAAMLASCHRHGGCPAYEAHTIKGKVEKNV